MYHLHTIATKHRGEQQLKCVGLDWIISQPKFAETYANMCEYVHITHPLVLRCLHTQLQRYCTQLHAWLVKEEKRVKQIKTATSACCLLLLSPAENEAESVGDGGGHAVLKVLMNCAKSGFCHQNIASLPTAFPLGSCVIEDPPF